LMYPSRIEFFPQPVRVGGQFAALCHEQSRTLQDTGCPPIASHLLQN
jgi:hypothetical protein